MVRDRVLVPEWEPELEGMPEPVHRLEAGYTVEARLHSMDYRIVHRKKPREHW